MTVVSLENRLRKLEATRRSDPALKAMSDDELAQALREASDDPADHAFANWFRVGCDGPLSAGVLDAMQRSL